MKNKRLLSYLSSVLMIALMFNIACKKDEDTNDDTNQNKDLHLSKINWTDMSQKKEYLSFQWSSDMKHVEAYSHFDISEELIEYQISYDASGKIDKVTQKDTEQKYSYDTQGKIINILGTIPGGVYNDTLDVSFSYSGEKLHQIEVYMNNSGILHRDYELYTLTWDGDNISKISIEGKDSLHDNYDFIQLFIYTYDTKINPKKGMYFFRFNNPVDIVEMYSKNNITSDEGDITWDYINQYPKLRTHKTMWGFTEIRSYYYWDA